MGEQPAPSSMIGSSLCTPARDAMTGLYRAQCEVTALSGRGDYVVVAGGTNATASRPFNATILSASA